MLLIAVLIAGCAGAGTARLGGSSKRYATHLIIVQSDATPAFAEVTQALIRRWPVRPWVISLDRESADRALVRTVRAHAPVTLVAIGLRAAQAVQHLGQKVVFCQVFDYEEGRVVSPSSKGVSALPPIAEQFRAWKQLQPRLERVGVMVGPHLDSLVRMARAAARANHIALTVVPVRSDLEVRYAVQRIGSRVQGLWLLPDNRILSRSVLRDVLSYSYRDGKSVLAPSAQFLALGALLSAESDPGDIAERVLERVRSSTGRRTIPGPAVMPLTRARFRINAVVAKRLGLTIPPQLRGGLYAPH